LKKHADAVTPVAEIPGWGAHSAQQIIAAVGVEAETFPSAGEFSSWAGICPGSNVSADQNQSSRSAKGNGLVRRILTQAAQAAVRKKGCHFPSVFRRLRQNSAIKGRFGRLPLGWAVWSGRFSTTGFVMLNEVHKPIPRPRNAVPRSWLRPCANLVTRSRSPRPPPNQSLGRRRHFHGSGLYCTDPEPGGASAKYPLARSGRSRMAFSNAFEASFSFPSARNAIARFRYASANSVLCPTACR